MGNYLDVTVTTAPAELAVETISSGADFDALEGWDELVRAMPRPSPVLLHGWLSAWWRHFGEGGRLEVQVAHRDGRLVGALPLCVLRRGRLDVLTFLGAEQTSLADLLLAQGESSSVATALAERARASDHDYADFHGLPSPSVLDDALGDARLDLIVRAEAPVLELNGQPWEDVYKARLSSKQRALRRRRQRQLAGLGRVEMTVARTPDELEPALEDAFELHALRWAGRPDGSEFGTEIGRRFYREATAAIGEADAARIVTLKLDGRPIAFVYNFVLAGCVYCHRLAFDPKLSRYSPGLVNRFDSLESAFEEGVTRVEFLGGMERYKVELTDRLEPLHEGLGLAHSLSGRAALAARLNGIRLRRFLKRSPRLRRFYYEGLAPARRALRVGGRS